MSNYMMGDQTVTIDRVHFETILRRANFNADDATCPAVSVSQSEYADLKLIANKYANLRQNLLRGGVGEETIDLLSHDDATIEQQAIQANQATHATQATQTTAFGPAEVYNHAPAFDSAAAPKARSYAPRKPHHSHGDYTSQAKAPNYQVHTREVPDWADDDVDEEDSASAWGGDPLGNSDNHGVEGSAGPARASGRPFYERQCARSLLLSNLAEGTTHADVTEAIRGGQLLEIHLRPQDRTAAVSFLLAADARALFDHVRRHDLYIRQKRVDVRWNDRQFILPGHVASKIATGATRNLVIRRCEPHLTEAVLRDDLEHIHNLIVVKVEFMNGSCYVKTNSVHNAMFARTCMMSRLKYKHNKIDWDVDECAQPIEQPVMVKPHKQAAATKQRSVNMTNRFQLLNLDKDEEGSLARSTPFSPENTIGITA
ncbi:unnamed protein product [Discula destructiva]